MIQKKLSKNKKIHGKQSDLFKGYRTGDLKLVSFSVDKRSCTKALGRISKIEHQNATEAKRFWVEAGQEGSPSVHVQPSRYRGWVSRFWTHVEVGVHFSVSSYRTHKYMVSYVKEVISILQNVNFRKRKIFKNQKKFPFLASSP